jgi:hypothetical protein
MSRRGPVGSHYVETAAERLYELDSRTHGPRGCSGIVSTNENRLEHDTSHRRISRGCWTA